MENPLVTFVALAPGIVLCLAVFATRFAKADR